MSKTLLLTIVISIAIAATVSGLTINNYFMVHQTNTVPSQPGMLLYQSDGTTPINSGQEISDLWAWTGTQFTLDVVIKNNGNTVLNTGLNTTFVPSGWTVSITGNGTLNKGDTQPVTVILLPNSTVGGTTSGDWDLWFTG
jgi:hypothetical protein